MRNNSIVGFWFKYLKKLRVCIDIKELCDRIKTNI